MGRDNATILFFPEGVVGPTNNCVGIGKVLLRRGHRVVFLNETPLAGALEEHGFEERLVTPKPRIEEEEVPGQFWIDFVRDAAPILRRPTIEQLAGFIAPAMQVFADGVRRVDDRLREIIDELRADVVVEDSIITFPALFNAGVPWVRVASCNPTEMKDHGLPPPFSGLASEVPAGWDQFWAAYRAALGPIHEDFSKFCEERGAPPLQSDDFIHESPWLNLYVFPDELDYQRTRPLGPHWHNLQACVRDTDPAWDVPEAMRDGEEPLIYLSLGPLGSADVELMRKLIDSLADQPYRVIVCKGPRAKEIELADNMAGAGLLPQVSILPKVDLVITHGGKNTVAESLYFGKPMIVLPIFWDQPDNARRLDETGYGVHLDTYGHSPEELTATIDRLLADREMAERLEKISARLQSARGTERAADLIEQVARDL